MKYLILIFILFACKATQISTTKQYRVIEAVKHGKQTDVKLQGLKGTFTLNSDTLKPNDLIDVTWLKRK